MTTTASVIVTTYNQETYIDATLRSVLAQMYRDLEIIVVDDGSTDNTPDRLTTFARAVTIVRQNNRGVAAPRNTGVRHAHGDLLAFLDGDDLWEPDKLAIQVQTAREHPRAGLIAADGVSFAGERKLAQSLYSVRLHQRLNEVRDHLVVGSFYDDLMPGNFISTTSQVMVPAAVLSNIGLSDESLPVASDYDLYLRIAALRSRMGLAGKQRVSRLFPLAQSANHLARLLFNALAGRPATKDPNHRPSSITRPVPR